jgi:hypothetical protein
MGVYSVNRVMRSLVYILCTHTHEHRHRHPHTDTNRHTLSVIRRKGLLETPKLCSCAVLTQPHTALEQIHPPHHPPTHTHPHTHPPTHPPTHT